MITQIGTEIALGQMRDEAFRNSQRWFPELHERGAWDQILHQMLGLVGEAGEAANIVKKLDRYGVDRDPAVFEMLSHDLRVELADVFTYLLNLCTLLGADLGAEFYAKQAVCEQRWGVKS